MNDTPASGKPVLRMIAALWEEKGYTSPDRHDINLTQLGQRVRIAEIGQEPGELVKIMRGETTLRQTERMFQTLPDNHPRDQRMINEIVRDLILCCQLKARGHASVAKGWALGPMGFVKHHPPRSPLGLIRAGHEAPGAVVPLHNGAALELL